EVAAARVGRVKAGRAAAGRVDGVLAAVDHDRGDRRAPVLAREGRVGLRRLCRRVVNDLLAGDQPGPAALGEAAVPLADPDRGRGAVGDVRDADGRVAVETAVER